EDAAERTHDRVLDAIHRHRASQHAIDRRHAAIRDSARHDDLKVLEVRPDVEPESVARGPPSDAHVKRDPLARDPPADSQDNPRDLTLAAGRNDPQPGAATDTADLDATLAPRD